MKFEYAVTNGKGRLIDYGTTYSQYGDNDVSNQTSGFTLEEILFNAIDNGHDIVVQTCNDDCVTGE